MAVAPDFRGRGLGKDVMQVAFEEAALRKDRTMILEVFEQKRLGSKIRDQQEGSNLGFGAAHRIIISTPQYARFSFCHRN
jgi:GNAT superfamily N-acetyltransferase